MSGAKSFRHKANAFSKSVWDPHITVIYLGSDTILTSTRQICFNGSGSSFQTRVRSRKSAEEINGFL
ncbi:6486_t:CDS:2 [Funneliformis mosseae]|uniref:6486_t:CDS:1 n=1 Tax=Funneliformis mosseae TaxID=27381 RepID=A0A9N9EWX7_FUNMO|nr:6486_t:CDS:2 [Funneliformis mosseae]